MTAEAVGERSGRPVQVGLALVREGLDLLLSASSWSLSDAEVRELVVDVTAQGGRLEAARGGLLREAVSREAPDARGQQGARTVNLLRSRCRVAPGRAAADVAIAKVTCPETGDLRAMGAALAAGEISREHVDVARWVPAPEQPDDATTRGPVVRQRAARSVPPVVVVTTPEQLAGKPGPVRP